MTTGSRSTRARVKAGSKRSRENHRRRRGGAAIRSAIRSGECLLIHSPPLPCWSLSLLRGTTRRAILFPTSTHQGAAPDRWMCTPASREARCGHHCGSPLTKVGAEEFSPTGHRGRLKFFRPLDAARADFRCRAWNGMFRRGWSLAIQVRKATRHRSRRTVGSGRPRARDSLEGSRATRDA